MKDKEPKEEDKKKKEENSSPNDKPPFYSKYRSALIGSSALFLMIILFVLFQDRPQKGITDISVSGNVPHAMPLIENAKPNPLELTFSHSAARLEHIDKKITEGITIKPQIDGTWRWDGDSSIIFEPKKDWPAGEKYTVHLDSLLFPDHVRLKKPRYNFSTDAFTFSIQNEEFYQDPVNPDNRKVLATVKFSHPINQEEFEKRISLFIFGKKKGEEKGRIKDYSYKVSYDKFMGEAYIHSDKVSIPLNDAFIKIVISKGVRPVSGDSRSVKEIAANVWIPGMYNFFRISEIRPTLVRNEHYEPEQVLTFAATNGVKPDDLKEYISLYLLPKDRPPTRIDKRTKKNYRWDSPSEITEDVLNIAEELTLEAMEAVHEYPKFHSFKFAAPQKRYMYAKIEKGLESYGGFILANSYETIVRIPDYPKEIKIMHDGALLSMSGNKQLSILSRGIKGIKFEVARVLSGDVNHLISQTGGDFKNPYFNNYKFNQDNITERYEEFKTLPDLGPQKAQYTSFNLTKYIKEEKQGLFFFKVESWDPKRKRGTGRSDKRLILITDLGMVVKENVSGSKEIFIQSIKNGKPIEGVQVEVLGKNGIAIVNVMTDSDGHAKLPDLRSFKREKEPTVYVAKKGEDMSFLPYERRDRGLNYSRFETGGVYTAGKRQRLNAYLFSDRGIYRPGDEVNIGLIVKHPDWKKDLEGVPLELTVVDVKGQEIKKKKITLSSEAFEEFQFKTEEYSPTGSYSVNAYIIKDKRRGNLLGSTSVKIEEFIPDRMKISTRFSKAATEGWVSPLDLKGHVSLKNLFGTPASNRQIAASMGLSPVYPYFSSYKDYVFHDPAKKKKSFHESLEEKETNENGEAEFEFNLKRFEKSTFRLTFTAEGFEAGGGRSVTSQSSILVSPLDYIIGYKKDGDLAYINKGSQRSIHLIAINSKLKPVEVRELTARIVEEQYVSVLTKQKNGVYKYQSVMKEVPVSDEDILIGEAGLSYKLPSEEPGDFALKIIDKKGEELNKARFSIVGQANLTRGLEKNAELQVKLNKKDFNNGDEIEVFIKAPYQGSGLITIEKDKVYAYKWFKTASNSSLQRISVPAALEGNAYVNVTFVRSMDSEEIFMSPLSYAVMPFTISKAKKDIGIELDVPSLIKPGDTMKINYKSKKPGKAIIFAVDEGILQVAKYETPKPLNHYFKKGALEVSTRQILDLILPEITMEKLLSAPGGGMYEPEEIGKNLNPFKRKRLKPVVFWSGLVDVDKSTKEVLYEVPDYFNGSLRVIAVAVAQDAIGSSDSKAIVRGDFVLSPNVPTFVAPGDEFEITLSVANNVEGSGETPTIKVSLESSEHLTILSEKAQDIVIAEQREETLTYRLRAADILGSGKMKFTASYGSKKATYTVHLSVRPPNPFMTFMQTGYGKKLPDVEVKREMHEAFRTLEASVSPLPLSISKGLLHYLNRFPYGCTEQLISKGFPAIALKGRPEFGFNDNKSINKYTKQTVDLIRGRQNPGGGFRYWPNGGDSNNFLSIYAAHFLTESTEKGIPVPRDMLKGTLLFLKDSLRKTPASFEDARVMAYAIYILTRNGEITTNYISSLTDYIDNNHKTQWKNDIMAVYLAASYKLLQKDKMANKLVHHYELGKERGKSYEYFFDTLISDAKYIDLVSRHFPDVAKKIDGDKLLSLIDRVIKGQHNTISSAYTILGLSAYAEVASETDVMELGIFEVLKDGSKRKLKSTNGLFVRGPFSAEAKKISFEGKAKYNLFYQVLESGFDKGLPVEVLKKRLEVQHEFRNTEGNVVNEAALGEELIVHIKIRSTDNSHLSNIAIVDLLPGGFEVVLDSVRGTSSGSTFMPDYIDVREDRVVIFGVAEASVKEFVYRIKATNKGKYLVPPAFGESMYDKEVQAHSKGSHISVIDKK